MVTRVAQVVERLRRPEAFVWSGWLSPGFSEWYAGFAARRSMRATA